MRPRALLLTALLFLSAPAWGGECLTPAQVWPKVVRWAGAFGLDPLLLYAVAWKESRFCAGAVGKAGEVGLGQVKPDTARSLGVDPAYLRDPEWNLYASAKYLRLLYERFRDWEKALMAYNGGPTRVAKGSPPEAARRYAQHVLWLYAWLKEKAGGGGRALN